MKLIGITGNMGTGKTLFSSFLKKTGIPVYCSDDRGKILMNNQNVIKKNIIRSFGKESYKKNKLNNFFLSKKVFSNPPALKLLCSIVHPWINLDFEKWKKNVSINNPLYIIKESAILFESGFYKKCDIIITLTSSLNKKLERIINRNKLSEEDIINRLNNQKKFLKKEKIKESINNIVINNNSSKNELQDKANFILKKI
ncbi:dephospho-CoA kinase [Blattabacterium cuenoti]|uniref:dephospho-CoA kinase n=1 Tax=Blattabacterium cuenoti TaxID=1653831 RepID=UPI001EEC28AC|nr:dephospho-CoA kinase [Blattabacterium cuenoti]